MQEATTRAIVEGLKEGGVNYVAYMPDSFFFDVIGAVVEFGRDRGLAFRDGVEGVLRPPREPSPDRREQPVEFPAADALAALARQLPSHRNNDGAIL